MAGTKRGIQSTVRAKRIAGVVLLALGVALLGFGGSERLVSWASPPQFEAAATIRTEPVNAVDAPTNSFVSDPYFLQTEFELLKSEAILDSVVTNLSLPREWAKKTHSTAPLTISECRGFLKNRMDSKIERGTNVITLLVRSDDQTEAAALANAVADSYFDFREAQRRERETALSNAAQAQLAPLEAKIKAARENAAELKEGLGNSPKPENGSTVTSAKSDAAIDKQSQLVKEEHTLSRLKTMDRQQLRNVLPAISTDAVLVALMEDLNRLELNVSVTRSADDKASSTAAQTRASIEELNQKIDARVAGILLNRETHIAVLREEIRQDEARAELTRLVNIQNEEKQQRYYASVQRVSELERSREALRAQNDALIKAAEIRRVEILNRATPPNGSAPDNVFLRPILFGIGGLLALAGMGLLIHSVQAR